jgi:hypothetical protein
LIQSNNIPKEWSAQRELTVPPLPTDIMEHWSQDYHWISRKLTAHPDFLWAFDRHPSCIEEVGSWIQAPPYLDPTYLNKRLERFSSKGIKKLVDGWFLRAIIDSFVGRWKKSYDTNGEIDRVELYRATEHVLERMGSLLRDTSELAKWAITASFRIEKKGRSRCYILMQSVRVWKYQELCLLRAELYDRRRLRIKELAKYFSDGRFHWQTCWFRTSQLDRRVTQHIQRLIGCISSNRFSDSDSSEYSSDESEWSP